jgi:uncharacterized protein (DUF1810 family)
MWIPAEPHLTVQSPSYWLLCRPQRQRRFCKARFSHIFCDANHIPGAISPIPASPCCSYAPWTRRIRGSNFRLRQSQRFRRSTSGLTKDLSPTERKALYKVMIIDSFNLQRFIDAQHPIYGQVRDELQAGQKESHWMWFIFPQIKGLGSSPTAQKYAIQGIDEAKAYLNHPLLGFRLRECTQLVNVVNGRSVEDIFGYPDNKKFHSSMTLFAHVSAGDKVFTTALTKYFHGALDRKTLDQL